MAPDYHVEVDGHWYSVPYRLIKELVDVRLAGNSICSPHELSTST
nr:hypothetical protein [Microvirga zambiensis]